MAIDANDSRYQLTHTYTPFCVEGMLRVACLASFVTMAMHGVSS